MQDWETDSWRAQTKPCVHQDPGKRSSGPTSDLSRLAHECPGVSSGGMGQWWPAAGLRCIESSSECMGLFEGGHHYLHYLHQSLASGQTTGREHSPAQQQKIGLQIYWEWPSPSEQDPVSLSISLTPQEASIGLLSFSIRGQREWKLQPQKTNQLITWTTVLFNSMKLWTMLCRATQNG